MLESPPADSSPDAHGSRARNDGSEHPALEAVALEAGGVGDGHHRRRALGRADTGGGAGSHPLRIEVVADTHVIEMSHGASGSVTAGGAVADEHAADPHGEELLTGDTHGTPATDTHAAEAGEHGDEHHDVHHVAHQRAMIMSLFAAGLGILLSWLFYIRRRFKSEAVQAAFPEIYRTLENKYWFDELYDRIFVKPVLAIAGWFAWLDRRVLDGLLHLIAGVTKQFAVLWERFVDRGIVDAAANDLAAGTYKAGSSLRGMQTGNLRQYVMFIVVGAVAIFLIISFFWNPVLAR